MPCTRPLSAYWAPGGQVAFNSVEGYSDRPFSIGCGQCPACRGRRAQDWVIRICHEAQMHECNAFVTLTYDQEHLPSDGGLHVEHFQVFIKALRKWWKRPLRYFHCGEYGEREGRPHYHAILFGIDFAWDRVLLERPGDAAPLFRSPTLSRFWTRGHSSLGAVTPESAAYVARYAVKASSTPVVDGATGEVLRPEYATMSRRPGLGDSWFEKFGRDVFPSDEVVLDGQKYRPPRYYDEKLSEDDLARIKTKRIRAAQDFAADTTPDRLRTREKFAVERSKSKKGSL